jgi:hypothetical protein
MVGDTVNSYRSYAVVSRHEAIVMQVSYLSSPYGAHDGPVADDDSRMRSTMGPCLHMSVWIMA